MKKKNLAVLLIIPFLISLLGIVTINTTFNLIENDILSISWNYSDTELFKISSSNYLLEAEGVSQSKYPAGAGNQLVWSVKNKNDGEEPHAEIIDAGMGVYYLKTLTEGEVVITCSNQKGNVFRSMNGIIYLNGAIAVNMSVGASGSNVDSRLYYGEYDLVNGAKQRATLSCTVRVEPSSLLQTLAVKSVSDNVKFDLSSGKIDILGPGDGKIVLGVAEELEVKDAVIPLYVVEGGVNVYTYDDLLYCTNRSQTGEIAVLRKSFESLESAGSVQNGTFVPAANNVELFGNYDVKTGTYAFANEVYRFATTYNKEYIKQWNALGGNTVSDQIIAGLRIQKDFYGNGYTLNLHNLCYPSGTEEQVDSSNNVHYVPSLKPGDLFRGPLPFYSLGDPNNLPLITAYGQDNVGVYVDGDGILLNDVKIKNCDFGNSLANLEYAGTVLEINGDGVTVKNSVVSNGKNVVRSFSSQNLTLDNCLIQNSRNFLFVTGSNEYVKTDGSAQKQFSLTDGSVVTASVSSFLSAGGQGDSLLQGFMLYNSAEIAKQVMKNALASVQNALNDQSAVEGQYKGSTEITNCKFYQSGISAICLESLFNGPFLYNNCPSVINQILGVLGLTSQYTDISGSSYPVKVNVSGSTKFYDYKKTDAIDLSGLIDENISTIVANMGDGLGDLAGELQGMRKITIDDIFPIKPILINSARANGCVYTEGETSYVNIPVAYYGGGVNLSTVTYEGFEGAGNLKNALTIDLVDNYLNSSVDLNNIDLNNISGSELFSLLKTVAVKAVPTVTGFAPFKFQLVEGSGYLYGETPSYSDLIADAKGN